ncbi:MAG: tetratricopeptide repeat protein [Alphaproteobacteria bacterium]
MTDESRQSASPVGQVITFYSFKGGCGRTMALANIACLLARRKDKPRVLVVDWDLEAPSLHRYFRAHLDKDRSAEAPGLIDLFLELDGKVPKEPREGEQCDPDETAERYIKALDLAPYIQKTGIEGIHLLAAGRFDAEYASKVNTFMWEGLYSRCPPLFRTLAAALAARYDYVLIDSRTGLTDIGGICTMLMPEKLVAVFTPNRQSLIGLIEHLRATLKYRSESADFRPLLIYPLPSRLDLTVSEKLKLTWRRGDGGDIPGYEPKFAELFTSGYGLEDCDVDVKDYFNTVQIQHIPEYSYGEEIAVLGTEPGDRLSLAASYELTVEWLAGDYPAWQSRERTNDIRFLEQVTQELVEARALVQSAETRVVVANKARDVYERSRKVFGDDDRRTLVAGDDLARALLDNGHWAEAEGVATAVLAHRHWTTDPPPPTVTDTSINPPPLPLEGERAGVRGWGNQHHPESFGTPLTQPSPPEEGGRGLTRRAVTPDTLSSIVTLVASLLRQNKIAEAARHLDAATAATRDLSDGDPVKWTLLALRGDMLHAQGDYVEARALREQALTARRRVLGEEHPSTLTSMSDLAWTLRAQGDLAGARALHEQALAVRRRMLGEEHPDTLTSMDNLAATLRAQGDLPGARALQEQVLAVRRRVMGEEHPDTLTSMNNLALTLEDQGDLAGARALEEQVLAVHRRVLGEEHPDTLTSMNNLAGTLWSQGDLPGARALHEQEYAICRRVLGEEHPDTLTSMGNLALTLGAQGDLAGARALLEQVLALRRKVLGEEHPDTLASMNNLAVTLEDQDDLAGARALEEQALAVYRRVLGEEHPATLTIMNNLASTLRAQGDLTGALALHERLLTLRSKILGEEHPHTLATLDALAEVTEAMGDAEGALRLKAMGIARRRRKGRAIG